MTEPLGVVNVCCGIAGDGEFAGWNAVEGVAACVVAELLDEVSVFEDNFVHVPHLVEVNPLSVGAMVTIAD